MYLKQCDEFVSMMLCPAFINFGYALWAAEVEEMYGSDLEKITGKGGKAVARNAAFGVCPSNVEVPAKAETSAPAAGGRGKSRATQTRSLARQAKPMELRRTFYRCSERCTSDR